MCMTIILLCVWKACLCIVAVIGKPIRLNLGVVLNLPTLCSYAPELALPTFRSSSIIVLGDPSLKNLLPVCYGDGAVTTYACNVPTVFEPDGVQLSRRHRQQETTARC